MHTFPGIHQFAQNNVEELTFKLKKRKKREYDFPEANEIAAIIPSHESTAKNRDLTFALTLTENGRQIQKLQKISQFNPYYDALPYVLLYHVENLNGNLEYNL